MWIATVYGFFSCTCPKVGATRDPKHIQIRARLRAHIPKVLAQFPDVFAGYTAADIAEDSGTDYRFRLIVTKEVFIRFLAELAMANNAHNFKDEVSKAWGGSDSYTVALHRMWHVGYDMQEYERKGETPSAFKRKAR